MTQLRQRMLDAPVLRSMAARTQESYLEAVSRLAQHYARSPELLSAHEVQQYLLHLVRDRYVPLADDLLALLRRYWQACLPGQWLFGSRAGQPRALHVQQAQRWYCRARDAAGITKVGGIHSLRHCYATHLLEAGVDLYGLQQWLGHNHVSTTTRYPHLAQPNLPDGARRTPLALLAGLPASVIH